MSFKNDIQATRFTAAGAGAIITQPVRLRGIIVASDGGGAGSLVMTTTEKTGTTLLQLDVPTGDVVNFSLPEDGILFTAGVFCSTATNIAAVTLLTDKFSGPNLTGQNG